MRAFLKPCVNSLLFDPNSICSSSCKNHTPFYQSYSHLNRMNFEFLFSHDSFITSSFPFGINYICNSYDDFELWVPLGSHVGVCFTSKSTKSRNRLCDITSRTTEINSLLAHTLPLGQLEDSLLIGATMESVSRAYSDI